VISIRNGDGKDNMITQIKDFAPYNIFIENLQNDPEFSDPMLVTEEQMDLNLKKSISRPNRHALGVFCGKELIGLFVFLIIQEEQYIEMLVGLSRVEQAYDEILQYLQDNYPGFQADFVFNPKNELLKSRLKEWEARFETELQKMTFTHKMPASATEGIEELSSKYREQYFSMHTKDMYWTGEKVVSAPEKFRTLIALEGETVVGYMDVTHCYKENEPYDLVVKEEYRRRGYGRKLLAKALSMNEPKDMMLLVEIDNIPAMRLYESMGFEKVQNQNNLTAHWEIQETSATTDISLG